jgi:hypothetical protein
MPQEGFDLMSRMTGTDQTLPYELHSLWAVEAHFPRARGRLGPGPHR